MNKRILAGATFAGAVVMIVLGTTSSKDVSAQAQGPRPVFEVDARFPQMAEGLVLGGVGGVAADSHGNVWAVASAAYPRGRQRARERLQGGAAGGRMGRQRQVPAGLGRAVSDEGVPVVQPRRPELGHVECESCSKDRRTNGDGRPGSGEHGIYVDHKDNVWLTGNGPGDGQVLKFSKDGKFLLQIGHGHRFVPDKPTEDLNDSSDTMNVAAATTVSVSPKTNEVFVADGYGNRRIVVFDADTGVYKRHWGAYGNKPDDTAPRTRLFTGPTPQQFNTVHGVTIGPDGVVYVADRANNRIQTFTVEGKFLREAFNRRESQGTGSAFGVVVSPDNRWVYVADGSNERVAVLDRATLEPVGTIGRPGPDGGRLLPHPQHLVDPKGNIITGESQGYRVQKFLYKGVSNRGTN